jgi:uncharacterized RmlC-like cupin family protein
MPMPDPAPTALPVEANLASGIRVIKPLQLASHLPQTAGMRRLAAVSHALAGSRKLWAGVVLVDPNSASAVHHHGPQETVVYVAEGRAKVRWGKRLEQENELEAGDFLFIAPFLPHQEINPSRDRPAYWVVVRSDPEPVVVNLTPGPDGEFLEAGAGPGGPGPKRE